MLPLTTTTVTVTRPANPSGDYEDDDGEAQLVATGLAVAITSPTGADSVVGGHQERVDAVLTTPPSCPKLTHLDQVVDECTGDAYRIAWTRRRRGLGLDHQTAGLVAVKGGASG
jgi:hypothetical protein